MGSGLINKEDNPDKQKMANYFRLNAEANRNIRRKLNLDTRWQNDLHKEMEKEGDLIANPMKVPKLKIAAGKFQKLYEENKQKQITENKMCKYKLYSVKGKGQWNICRDLSNKGASP